MEKKRRREPTVGKNLRKKFKKPLIREGVFEGRPKRSELRALLEKKSEINAGPAPIAQIGLAN